MSKQPLIFAHRGAREDAPENTLPAFDLALAMKADGIELDVQCSKDGQLMVIHDFTLDKTTSGTGRVRAFTAGELFELDAGSHFSTEFADTRIPTLAEVFDLVGNRGQVNVELKTDDPQGGNEVEPVIELIQQRKCYDQVIVSSFNPVALIKMRYLDPAIKLGLLYFAPLPDYLKRAWLSPIIAPEALHPYFSLIDSKYMAWARTQDYAVNTWTVNDLDEAQRLADLGVDVIMTDVPDKVIAMLR